mmetsp:Transcript_110604/g.238060  ORF Transcript_110604/g.238060 Transcript_110604/m.238060 type:complete len:409 (-) Transcript_110604:471-1697(-)
MFVSDCDQIERFDFVFLFLFGGFRLGDSDFRFGVFVLLQLEESGNDCIHLDEVLLDLCSLDPLADEHVAVEHNVELNPVLNLAGHLHVGVRELLEVEQRHHRLHADLDHVGHVQQAQDVYFVLVVPHETLLDLGQPVEVADVGDQSLLLLFVVQSLDLGVDHQVVEIVQLVHELYPVARDGLGFGLGVVQLHEAALEDVQFELEDPDRVRLIGLLEADDVEVTQGQHLTVLGVLDLQEQNGFLRDLPLEDVQFLLYVEHLELILHRVEQLLPMSGDLETLNETACRHFELGRLLADCLEKLEVQAVGRSTHDYRAVGVPAHHVAGPEHVDEQHVEFVFLAHLLVLLLVLGNRVLHFLHPLLQQVVQRHFLVRLLVFLKLQLHLLVETFVELRVSYLVCAQHFQDVFGE